MSHRLLGSRRPLAEVYDVALLDLDGVVYVGDRPVAGAPAALAGARAAGMRLAFVTNNASRTVDAVAARLSGMGVPAAAAEVTTSAQAAARHLAAVLAPGAAVLVVGGPGLVESLRDRGLRPVTTAFDPSSGEPVSAVAQGFDAATAWPVLAEAAVAIRAGARWVATNLDRTIPSERGPLPGNGSLVQVLTHALGIVPESTGKPDPTMHRESVERSAARRPLVVGDRLDTDVEGAVRAGAPSLLVLSGVTDAAGLLAAGPGERPDYVARDVAGLTSSQPEIDWSGGPGAERLLGAWRATVVEGRVHLAARLPVPAGAEAGDTEVHAPTGGAGVGGTGVGGDVALDALRLVAPAVWRCRDDAGGPGASTGANRNDAEEGPPVVAVDASAAAVLQGWGLAPVRTSHAV